MGLADRRPPSEHQLLRARRPAGDDPSLHGLGAGLARFGKYSGTRVFAAEEEHGHALMRSLSTDERRRATVGKDLPSELLTAAFRDNHRSMLSAFVMVTCRRKAVTGSKRCWVSTPAGCSEDMQIPLRGGERAPGRHAFCVDWAVRRYKPILLSYSEPGHPCRIRSPVGHRATTTTRPRETISTPWCARRTAMTTARTCCGSTISSITMRTK